MVTGVGLRDIDGKIKAPELTAGPGVTDLSDSA